MNRSCGVYSCCTRPRTQPGGGMQATVVRFLLTISICVSPGVAQNSPETPTPHALQTTIIKAGLLIDPATGTSSRNEVIRVEAGKITAVGSAVQISSDATVVDLS